MKLHLPLSLRSALLAVCALVGSASASVPDMHNIQLLGNWQNWKDITMLNDDFVAYSGTAELYMSGHDSPPGILDTYSVHSFYTEAFCVDGAGGSRQYAEPIEVDIHYNGNNRTYSYTVDIDPTKNTVAWVIPYKAGMVAMTGMKDITVRGTTYAYVNSKGEYLTPQHQRALAYDGPFGGLGLRTASYSNNISLSISNSDSFTFENGSAVAFQGALTTNGTVSFSNVDSINIINNRTSVIYDEGNFTVTGSEKVLISGNKSFVFGYVNAAGVTASFVDVKELIFRDNEQSIFAAYGTSPDKLNQTYKGCESILVENNTAERGVYHRLYSSSLTNRRSTVFEDCARVTFRNNIATGYYLFDSVIPEFKDCGIIEFVGNEAKTGSVISPGLKFSGISKGIYIKNNTAGCTNSTGALLKYNATIEASGATDMKAEFVIANNTAEGNFSNLFGSSMKVSSFDRLEISDNTVRSTHTTAGDFLGKLTADHVNHILIHGNVLSAKAEIAGFIKVESATDFGTFEISDNTMGYGVDGEIVGSGKAITYFFSPSTFGGESNSDNDSKLIIKGNKIGMSKYISSANSNTFRNLHTLEVSGNGSVNVDNLLGKMNIIKVKNVIFTGNTLDITGNTKTALLNIRSLAMTGGEKLTISGNTTTSTGSLGSGAVSIGFESTAVDNVITVKEVNISNNKAIGTTATAGAIRVQNGDKNYALGFKGCEDIFITNNGAQSKVLTDSLGGAIVTGSSSLNALEFNSNSHVVIRGNYITDGEQFRLKAFDTTKDLNFKTKAGQTIELYDAAAVKTVLNINGDSVDQDAQYKGKVTFSGVYTEKDLKMLNGGANASSENVLASRTIEANKINVYNGTLSLEDNIQLVSEKNFTSLPRATVSMRNATLHLNSTSATAILPTAVFEGHNALDTNVLTATNGTWTFKVGSINSKESIVAINFTGKGKLTTEGQTFHVEHDSALASGKYMLLEFDQSAGSWIGSDKLAFTGTDSTMLGSAGQDDVYYTVAGNKYTLWYDYTKPESNNPSLPDKPAQPEQPDTPTLPDTPDTPIQPETPAQRGTTTLTWVAANGIWADATGKDAGAWSGNVEDLNYYTGDSVVFNKSAAVTVGGVVRPADVLVSNEGGQVVFTSANSGQITGATAITKMGAGELVLNLANAYTGATTIKAGKVTVGNANAFGLSNVELQGGTLNLTELAVSNSVRATGKAAITGGSAYVGKLTLAGGELTGEAINLATEAELLKGSMANDLIGTGSVVKNSADTVMLSGKLSHKGGTTVNAGTLALQGATLSGNLTVNEGGKLVMSSSSFAGTITLNAGAALEGSVSVAKGGKLIAKAAQTLKGDLALAGGTVTLADTLIVTGSVSSTAQTTMLVDMKALMAARQMDIIKADDTSKVHLEHINLGDTLESARIMKEKTSSALYVELNSQTLVWDKNTTGVWELKKDGADWETDEGVDDKRFFNLDSVVFENAGDVKIVGTVEPGTISVKGDEDTTFTGEGHITGAAELVKEGKGKLTLATDNSGYSGEMYINAGTLEQAKENALGSGTVHIDGAVFAGGDFEIKNSVIFTGDGNKIGGADKAHKVAFVGATVDGSYTLAKDNTLSVSAGIAPKAQTATPSGSTFTGKFTFDGGTLELSNKFSLTGTTVFQSQSTIDLTNWEGTFVSGETYELLFINGLKETDANKWFTLSGLDEVAGRAILEFENESLWLTIRQPQANPEIAAKLNRNQRAAYAALDTIAREDKPTGELEQMGTAALDATTAAEAAAILNRLNGAELATAMTSQIVGNKTHLHRLRANMGSGYNIDAGGKNAVYLVGYDDRNNIDKNDDGLGIKRTEWGGMIGYERSMGEQSIAGVALSSGSADVKPTNAAGYKEDATRVDLYFVAQLGDGWQSVTSVGLGVHSFDITRHLPYGLAAKSSVDGFSFNLQQEISYTVRMSESSSWQPFASVELTANSIDSFSESGAGTASLAGDSRTATAVDITLGARYIHTFAMAGSKGSVHVQAGVVASIGDTTADLNLHFAGAPSHGFTVSAASYDGIGFNIGAGVALPLNKNTAITGSVNAILRSGAEEAGASVGLRVIF